MPSVRHARTLLRHPFTRDAVVADNQRKGRGYMDFRIFCEHAVKRAQCKCSKFAFNRYLSFFLDYRYCEYYEDVEKCPHHQIPTSPMVSYLQQIDSERKEQPYEINEADVISMVDRIPDSSPQPRLFGYDLVPVDPAIEHDPDTRLFHTAVDAALSDNSHRPNRDEYGADRIQCRAELEQAQSRYEQMMERANRRASGDSLERIQEDFRRSHEGTHNAHKPIILEEPMVPKEKPEEDHKERFRKGKRKLTL